MKKILSSLGQFLLPVIFGIGRQAWAEVRDVALAIVESIAKDATQLTDHEKREAAREEIKRIVRATLGEDVKDYLVNLAIEMAVAELKKGLGG